MSAGVTGAAITAAAPLESDARRSLRNAFTLGASLVLTWSVGIGIKLLLPRYLGPSLFGAYQFADAFTVTLFIVTGFGLETYIRKEVSTRPEHASDFFGGTLALRFALGIPLVGGALLALLHAGKPPVVQHLVLWLGGYQFLLMTNLTLAAILQSVGTVNGLAVLNVASKVLTGVGIIVGFEIGAGVESIGAAFLLAELCRSVGLWVLSRRHTGLNARLHVRSTIAVFVASIPFYLSDIAQTAYAKINVTIMAFLTTNIEVGWYGAASNLAGLSLLLTPLIVWVLDPMTSRAVQRSDAQLRMVVCRAMELILTGAIPVTLLLALGADVIVPLVFGPAFVPATDSLRIIAPVFVLTYMAIVGSSTLVRLERPWPVTWLSAAGLVISPVLSVVLIPRSLAALGPGGAGVGAAAALVITEALITLITVYLVREYVFDRRSLVRLGKMLVVSGVVVALDRALVSLGGVRLLADALVYVGGVIAWRAVDIREIFNFVRGALRRGDTDARVA